MPTTVSRAPRGSRLVKPESVAGIRRIAASKGNSFGFHADLVAREKRKPDVRKSAAPARGGG